MKALIVNFDRDVYPYQISINDNNKLIEQLKNNSTKQVFESVYGDYLRDIFRNDDKPVAIIKSPQLAGMTPNNLLLTIGSLIGNMIHYPHEGSIVMDIKPQKTNNTKPSYKTSTEFQLHTDMSYIENPPDIVGLYMINSDIRNEARCLIADTLSTINSLSKSTLQELRKPQYTFEAPEHFKGQKFLRDIPIIEGAENRPTLRFRKDNIICNSAYGRKAVEALFNALQKNTVKFAISKGDMLFYDNKRLTHGRTAFTPTYEESDRHLKRAYFNIENSDKNI